MGCPAAAKLSFIVSQWLVVGELLSPPSSLLRANPSPTRLWSRSSETETTLSQTVCQHLNLGPVWSSLSTHRDHPDQKHQVARYQRFVPELRRVGWGTLPWGGAGEGSPQRWGGPRSPYPGCFRSLLVFRSGSPHLKYSQFYQTSSPSSKEKKILLNIINVSLYCK